MTVKPSLKFSPNGHKYWLDGRPIPGVTTLLGKGLPKPAIPPWAARSVAEFVIQNPQRVEQLREMGEGPAIAALKQVPWQKRDQAAIDGTNVHALSDKVIHGEPVDVPEHYVNHVQGYVDFLEDFDVRPILTERPVASRKHWYAGTFDGIVTFGRGKWAGRTALIDIKTSTGVYGETALQTAAYALAEFYQDTDGVEQPMPDIDCTGVAHVTDAGTKFHPLCHTPDDITEAHKTAMHIFWVAKRTDWIKGLVGEPFELESA